MTGKKFIKYVAVSVLAGLLLTGCAQGGEYFTALLTGRTDDGGGEDSTEPEVNIMKQKGVYDSEDAAVVVKKDLEAGTVQFQNIATSRRYTLVYDGATLVYDKNDQALSMEQLKEGSVATVRFYKPTKTLASVRENPDCISFTKIKNYEMDLKKGTITIGNELYNISGHVVVVSDGRETDMMEVNQIDEISVWGYKNMIYGINVETGHGYLRLQNEEYFVNGWIDVGGQVITKVAQDMLIVVPEGTHTVTVSHKGSSATQEINFARGEEMAWDLADVEITVVQRGNVIFTLTPATSKVFIDGREVDVSKPVPIEYGLHQMRITADGYDTVAQYIRVGEPSANISVELEKSSEEESAAVEKSSAQKEDKDKDKDNDEDNEDEEKGTGKKYASKSSDTSESEEEEEEEERPEKKSSEKDENTPVVSTAGKYKVYIDAPDGVEAYLDGNYIGVTPVSFNKTPGSYVVTLRKSGYQPRSYTLQIDDEEKDVNYSFTQLVKIEE